jgi:hypothetical protein
MIKNGYAFIFSTIWQKIDENQTKKSDCSKAFFTVKNLV